MKKIVAIHLACSPNLLNTAKYFSYWINKIGMKKEWMLEIRPFKLAKTV